MAFSKIILNGTTLMDSTIATATASDITSPKTAMLADGVMTTGTGSGGGGVSEITIASSGAVSQELLPNTVYHFTSEELTSLTITLGSMTSDSQYHFDFISPETPAVLTLPQTVSMSNSFSVEPNTRYEIDIVDNYGVFAEWVYEVTE